MHVANRIRAAVALSALLLVAAVATGCGGLAVTLLAILPGAWIGGWASTTAFVLVSDARAASRARRRHERRMRRAHFASTSAHSRVTLLTCAA